jgi:hypothetical protein
LLDDLAYAHPKDKALRHAYSAAVQLSSGIGAYVQYLVGVASGRQNRTELMRAVNKVAAGKRLAHTALAELR